MIGAARAGDGTFEINSQIKQFIAERTGEFDQISAERKAQLEKLSAYVNDCQAVGRTIKLTFICTHNSRRSHMSQLWAAAAAAHYGVAHVETYSGGTESTAFNPKAIAALKWAGFTIDDGAQADNPRYQVTFAARMEPIVCFSKVYDSEPNPMSDYCAVMTCSEADEACPVVRGAALRLAIPFEDPKIADGTPEESARYDERCAQIAREMLYAFSQVK